MRLSELRGATSFRLALMFAALFGTASFVFAATIYVMASHFLSGNPDERMRAESASFDKRPGHQTLAVLDQHSVDDLNGRRPFGLFDSAGRWLGGNLHHLPSPRPPLEEFFETTARDSAGNTIYRSFLHRLPNGNLIVVSRNIDELAKFRSELLEITCFGLALMALLGIGGGMLIGISSVRRLNKVTQAILRITEGDLTGRLPSRGTNDDVDRLVGVVNSMLEQIERLMGEVKGVCDSIAHDLRTPLTRLLAGLERASRRNLSATERRAEVDCAIAEVKTMLRTFAALLRISEIEDGARRASFREIDLTQVVADAVDHYEPAAEEKAIRLTFLPAQVPPTSLVMHGDVDLLFEAVANLLDNAIKFTPSGGHITVQLHDGPEIVITDSGAGIAREDREQVKLRFHRGTSSRQAPGNGLGLPLVGAIARLHGLEFQIDDGNPGCRVAIKRPSIGWNAIESVGGH